jgi:hypothetical protein
METIVKSWRTTLFGVLGIVGAIVSAVMALIDGNPATNPNWELTFSAIMAGVAAIFAKDAKVSNAPSPGPAVGVPPTPPPSA